MKQGDRLVTFRRILIVVIAIAIAAVAFILLMPKQRQVTDLERITLKEYSEKITKYIDDIDFISSETPTDDPNNPTINGISLDRYIAFVLDYSKNENSQKTLSANNIKTIAESLFDVNLDESAIDKIGISPLLLDKNISFSYEDNSYYIEDTQYSKRDIANIPIAKYILKSVDTSNEDNTYTVSFDKYVIKSPYDALSHIEADESFNVNDYLNGKGKISEFKSHISTDNISEFAELEKETVITYKINQERILIKSIK